MRILLLNLYYPPDTSATAKMAQTVVGALAKKHDVTVVCGRPSYDPTERRSWRWSQTEVPKNSPPGARVRIIRVGSTDYPRAQMQRRVLNYLTYAAICIPRAAFINCDVIVGMTDPPFQGIVAAFVSLLRRKPFVYNIRDLYPDMASGGSILRPGLLTRLWEWSHRRALRRATRVVVLGEDMRARIQAKGIDAKRIAVVRDGADLTDVNTGLGVDNDVVNAIRGDFRYVLVHAGNLGFYGAWETLISAAHNLADEGIGLVFVGDGAQRREIEAMAAVGNNVRFLPFFPTTKITSVLAAADVHVVTVKRGLEGVIVPSKMYGILAAGKPILAVAPRETDVVALGERKGFAVWGDPENSSQVTAAIREIFADAGRLRRMSDAARAAANDYDRVTELRKFVEVVEEARPA